MVRGQGFELVELDVEPARFLNDLSRPFERQHIVQGAYGPVPDGVLEDGRIQEVGAPVWCPE